MSFAQLRSVFASSSFRLSAVYAGILLAAFLLAGIGAVVASRNAAQDEVRQRVRLEMDALQREIRTEGLAAAVAAIRTRADSPGSLEYQLIAGDGRALLSDLAIADPHLGWSLINLPEARWREESSESFLVLTQQTPDGGLLTIGDDLDRGEHLRGAVLRTLIWVGFGALALAILAGIAATRLALQRMDGLSKTMTRVGAGDLSARAPEGGAKDDIEQLGRGINQMLSRIELLVANVKRVSTDIAHELRTPLAHVRQQLEFAAQTSDIATAQEAMRLAQAKIDDVLRVFAAMLRLAEIDSGAGRARFSSLDLASLVERVVDAYRPDIEAAGRSFTVAPVEPCTIVGDADLLAQALGNLLENALRHTPKGSPIALSLRALPDLIRLQVEDRGSGIPASDRDRALGPFVRLDPSRTSAGAGLGLSIVSAVARLHKAHLLLEDAEPGLRVTLEFPRPD